MASLPEPIKAFIVQQLACYDTPTQVAEAVFEEFGLRLERQQVANYDPTKAAGKRGGLSKKWHDLFEATRKAFQDETAKIPIAQQAFRLRTLNRLLERTERQGNTALVAQLLEQAAKEVGGTFTNKVKHAVGGDPDAPPVQTKADVTLSPDEAYKRMLGGG